MPTKAARKTCGFMENEEDAGKWPRTATRGAFRLNALIASRESPVRRGKGENVSRREIGKQMAKTVALSSKV
jgi:hypothetical protein